MLSLPDGRLIVFSTDSFGESGVYLVREAGGGYCLVSASLKDDLFFTADGRLFPRDRVLGLVSAEISELKE